MMMIIENFNPLQALFKDAADTSIKKTTKQVRISRLTTDAINTSSLSITAFTRPVPEGDGQSSTKRMINFRIYWAVLAFM